MVDVDQVTSELVVKLGERLLGPTVDIAGQALKSWTRQQVEYVLRVFQKAVLKLGAKIERPGTVPLKILKEVLTEAQFCSDELTSEYLAGVLASSRTELGKDDRGITYLKLTSQLSSYQIRFHYVCYSFWHSRSGNNWLRTTWGDAQERMTVALTHEFLFATVIDSPEPKSESVLLHCVSGLSRLGLIQNLIEGLPLDFNNFAAKKGWTLPEGTMFIVRPTTFGGEYFLWGTGNGDIDPWTYADLPKDLPGTNMLSLRGKPEVLSATTASSDKLQRRN